MLLQLLLIGLTINSFYICSDGKMDVISELEALQSEQNLLRDQHGLIKADQKAIKAAQLAMRESIGLLISAQHLIKADQGLILQEFTDGKQDLSKLNLDLQELRKTQRGFKKQLLLIKDGQAKLLEMLNNLNSTVQ